MQLWTRAVMYAKIHYEPPKGGAFAPPLPPPLNPPLVLPTGYGKSLCFGCLPLAFDRLNSTRGSTPASIVVVVTPQLISLSSPQRFNLGPSLGTYIPARY